MSAPGSPAALTASRVHRDPLYFYCRHIAVGGFLLVFCLPRPQLIAIILRWVADNFRFSSASTPQSAPRLSDCANRATEAVSARALHEYEFKQNGSFGGGKWGVAKRARNCSALGCCWGFDNHNLVLCPTTGTAKQYWTWLFHLHT